MNEQKKLYWAPMDDGTLQLMINHKGHGDVAAIVYPWNHAYVIFTPDGQQTSGSFHSQTKDPDVFLTMVEKEYTKIFFQHILTTVMFKGAT